MQSSCLWRVLQIITYEVSWQLGCCLWRLQYCYFHIVKIASYSMIHSHAKSDEKCWSIRKREDKKLNLKYREPFLDVHQPHTLSVWCRASNRKGLAGTRYVCVCVVPVCMYVNVSVYLEGTSTFKITCQLSCSGWQMWDGALRWSLAQTDGATG